MSCVELSSHIGCVTSKKVLFGVGWLILFVKCYATRSGKGMSMSKDIHLECLFAHNHACKCTEPRAARCVFRHSQLMLTLFVVNRSYITVTCKKCPCIQVSMFHCFYDYFNMLYYIADFESST